jgi:tetratricopeptide (TPR) repeat protein
MARINGIFLLFFILCSANIFAENDWEIFTSDNPVYNMLGEYTYNITVQDVTNIAKEFKKTNVDYNSAVSLNTFGYGLYEQKKFGEAATVFRRAVQLDPSYAYPHYNLACMLSLLSAEGQKINPGELIYHLQCAALLEPKYRTKPKTDTDLDPVRGETYFKDYLDLLAGGEVILRGKNLYLNTKARQVFVTGLIEGNAGPLFVEPQISESPDKKAAAFMASYQEEYHIFILTSYGLLIKVTQKGFGDLYSVFYCPLVWQPLGKGLLCNIVDTLSYYDLKSGRIKEVFKAGGDSVYIGCIADYSFFSPTVIRFMGGTFFEYSFAGKEYEINLDGTNFHLVPGGRVEHGEDLRGGDPEQDGLGIGD